MGRVLPCLCCCKSVRRFAFRVGLQTQLSMILTPPASTMAMSNRPWTSAMQIWVSRHSARGVDFRRECRRRHTKERAGGRAMAIAQKQLLCRVPCERLATRRARPRRRGPPRLGFASGTRLAPPRPCRQHGNAAQATRSTCVSLEVGAPRAGGDVRLGLVALATPGWVSGAVNGVDGQRHGRNGRPWFVARCVQLNSTRRPAARRASQSTLTWAASEERVASTRPSACSAREVLCTVGGGMRSYGFDGLLATDLHSRERCAAFPAK